MHSWDAKAIHDAAYLLPNWPRPLQLTLVCRWAADDGQTQKEIANLIGYIRETANRKEKGARRILNTYYCYACKTLRSQLSELLA